MQIPKKAKKQPLVKKNCSYEGCGTPFEGCRTSKYCEFHRIQQNRVKEKQDQEHVTVKNQVFEHDFKSVKTIIQKCALDGCGQEFEVKIFPRQFVYPKYCPEHRNEHKRKSFLEGIRN
jgi:arginyl-tRNA--protein-N-Asp/Glu arginylyltransferase